MNNLCVSDGLFIYMFTYVYVYVCMCTCVCVCVHVVKSSLFYNYNIHQISRIDMLNEVNFFKKTLTLEEVSQYSLVGRGRSHQHLFQ